MTRKQKQHIEMLVDSLPNTTQREGIVLRMIPKGELPHFVSVADFCGMLSAFRNLLRVTAKAVDPEKWKDHEADWHICRMSCDSTGVVEVFIGAHDAKAERARLRAERKKERKEAGAG